MRTLVVDTSVVVKWILPKNESGVSEAELLIEAMREGKLTVFVPELVKYEVGNVWIKGKLLSTTQIKVVSELFYALPLQFVAEDEQQANLSCKIAEKYLITYYDAVFLALAKLKKTKLVTDDNKMCLKTMKSGLVIPLVDFSSRLLR